MSKQSPFKIEAPKFEKEKEWPEKLQESILENVKEEFLFVLPSDDIKDMLPKYSNVASDGGSLGEKKIFSLPALFLSLYRLQEKELDKRQEGSFLTYNDIKDIVERELEDLACKEMSVSKDPASNNHASDAFDAFFMIREEDIEAHAGLLYEVFMRPIMSSEGPRLMLREESFVMREEEMLRKMEECLKHRNEGEKSKCEGSVERFMCDGARYSLGLRLTSNQREGLKNGTVNEAVTNMQYENIENAFDNGPGEGDNGVTIEDQSRKTVIKNIERDRTMIRVLAHIRKAGMDVIFPQEIYDKVLLTMFMALKCGAPLAHREVMDMVLAVKEARVLGEDLEPVSKTKVRGILTLLKNCHSIRTGPGEGGEGIRLFLGEGVSDFKSFRDKHDLFLGEVIAEIQIFIPVELRCFVFWMGNEEERTQKAREFEEDEKLLENYYVHGIVPERVGMAANAILTSREGEKSWSEEDLRSESSSQVGYPSYTHRSAISSSVAKPRQESGYERDNVAGGEVRKTPGYDFMNPQQQLHGTHLSSYSRPSQMPVAEIASPPPHFSFPYSQANNPQSAYSSFHPPYDQQGSSQTGLMKGMGVYSGRPFTHYHAVDSKSIMRTRNEERGGGRGTPGENTLYGNVAAIPATPQALFAQALTHIRPRKPKENEAINATLIRSPHGASYPPQFVSSHPHPQYQLQQQHNHRQHQQYPLRQYQQQHQHQQQYRPQYQQSALNPSRSPYSATYSPRSIYSPAASSSSYTSSSASSNNERIAMMARQHHSGGYGREEGLSDGRGGGSQSGWNEAYRYEHRRDLMQTAVPHHSRDANHLHLLGHQSGPTHSSPAPRSCLGSQYSNPSFSTYESNSMVSDARIASHSFPNASGPTAESQVFRPNNSQISYFPDHTR